MVSDICKKFLPTKGIYSTVANIDEELIAYLKSNLKHFVFLDETVNLPITVQYKTPKTLGKDRLAAGRTGGVDRTWIPGPYDRGAEPGRCSDR